VLNLVYGALLLHGCAWVVLPTARRLAVFADNMAVRRRNLRRKRVAALLLGGPRTPIWLNAKLGAARALAQRGRHHEVGRAPAEYTTARSVLEQAGVHEPVRDRWDAELRRRTGGGTEGEKGRKGPRLTLGRRKC
jgi:hypothetical protein